MRAEKHLKLSHSVLESRSTSAWEMWLTPTQNIFSQKIFTHTLPMLTLKIWENNLLKLLPVNTKSRTIITLQLATHFSRITALWFCKNLILPLIKKNLEFQKHKLLWALY